MSTPYGEIAKVELHQHVDGSIPVEVTWELMQRHDLAPVESIDEMRRLLALQPDEEGSLLTYLDKFHYPLWVTQFFDNLTYATYRIVRPEDAEARQPDAAARPARTPAPRRSAPQEAERSQDASAS